MANSEVQEVRKNLPIYSARGKLLNECREHYSLIIVGETGSGKTTQLPQVTTCEHVYAYTSYV